MAVVSLENKRIVITGAARGLGRGFAEAALDGGARVVIADILEDRGRQTADELSSRGEVSFQFVDLADPASIEALAERAEQILGGIDGLVNCAAIATGIGGKMSDEIDIETWDRVMTVNVRGTWLAVKAFTPALRKAGNGKIVNVASDTAMWGAPRLLHYVASKGAVISMTRSLARELGDDNIRANVIAPGFTLTEASLDLIEDAETYGVTRGALKRSADAKDMVGSALYLASDLAGFVTGQTLIVDGGRQFI